MAKPKGSTPVMEKQKKSEKPVRMDNGDGTEWISVLNEETGVITMERVVKLDKHGKPVKVVRKETAAERAERLREPIRRTTREGYKTRRNERRTARQAVKMGRFE